MLLHLVRGLCQILRRHFVSCLGSAMRPLRTAAGTAFPKLLHHVEDEAGAGSTNVCLGGA